MNRRTCWTATAICTLVVACAGTAGAQEAPAVETPSPPAVQSASAPAATPTTPVTPGQRVDWIVSGVVGPKSLFAVGPISAAWHTAWNTPEEWGQTWSGFGKRYLQREADVALSNSIEAGLGAIWGEDPRFVSSHRQGIWPRARFAMKTVVLAPRRDGHLAPAWGRYAGNTFNNLIETTWLPPSASTPTRFALNVAAGFGGRLAGNLWDEFWPDARRYLRKRRP